MSLDAFEVGNQHTIVDLAKDYPYMGEKDKSSLISESHSLIFLLFQEYYWNEVQEEYLQAPLTCLIVYVILVEECMLLVVSVIFSVDAPLECDEVSTELARVDKFNP